MAAAGAREDEQVTERHLADASARYRQAQQAAKAAEAELNTARCHLKALERRALDQAAAAGDVDGCLHLLACATIPAWHEAANEVVAALFSQYQLQALAPTWAQVTLAPDRKVLLPTLNLYDSSPVPAGLGEGLLGLLDRLETTFGPLGDQVHLEADEHGRELVVNRTQRSAQLVGWDYYAEDVRTFATGPLDEVLQFEF